MHAIKQLFDNKRDAIRELGITFNNPCTEQDIIDLQLQVSQPLPQDLIEFYTFCNGFETEDYMFRVIPISEVIDYRSELKGDTLYFAEYMIYSDEWLIRLNRGGGYDILNGDHSKQKTVIKANSILAFLETYLNKGLFSTLDNNSFWDRLARN